MANVELNNAENVDCLYTGQTMSLFVNLSRRSAMVARCTDSTVEDVPIEFSLTLQRIDGANARLPTSSKGLLVVPRQRERGAGADLVSFAVERRDLLKITIDLATCSERSKQLTLANPASVEHILIDKTWVINDALTLLFELRTAAHAAWPVLLSPQWADTSFSSYMLPTLRSCHDCDVSESALFLAEDSPARAPSTVRSMASRTTRLFNPSEPRSQLQSAIFVDQTLFPVIRILFVPELFTKNISTPPSVVWNMTLQISVEKSAVRKTARRTLRERATKREPRRQGETVNLEVEESVLVSSTDWEEGETKTPRQVAAIALAFNADYRDPASVRKGDGDSISGGVACDVARATRLVVDDFTFTVLVSTKQQPEVQVEEILRTVHSYWSEHDEMASVLDLDLDDLMNYIYDRYAYMKVTPYFDGMSFHDTVWQAVRWFVVNSITEGEGYDAEVDDEMRLLDGVLASA